MENVDAREVASKAASEKRAENLELTHYSSIPKDIEFATLDDLDDINPEENFTVVPIEGKSGKFHNWLIRRLKAGERSALNQSMFPKSVLQKMKNMKAQSPKKDITMKDIDMSVEEMTNAMFRRDCLTIKKATVFPKGVTTEHIENLATDDFDRLLEAVNIDVNADDNIARFHQGNGLADGEPEVSGEVKDTASQEE